MNGNVEFRGKKQYGENLVEAAETGSVNLTVVQRTRLEKLLEHDSVLAVFACGNFDTMFANFLPDPGVTQDVIRRSWLLDEEGLEFSQMGKVWFSFWYRPDLSLTHQTLVETSQNERVVEGSSNDEYYLIRVHH